MPSYGECDIAIGMRIAGAIRIVGLAAAHAIHPRLLLLLECSLRELEESAPHHAPALKSFSLLDLSAELRLHENGPAVMDLRWLDKDRRVQSFTFESGTQITLAGDLDSWRLERLERNRNGEPPVFWLQLWPTVLGPSGPLQAKVHPVRLQVPREVWHEFLAKVGYGEFEIVELPSPAGLEWRFPQAVPHIREAKRLLREGQYDQAVLSCRKVVDVIRGELSDDRFHTRLRESLARTVGDNRADAYVAVVKQLKQLAAPAAHAFGSQNPHLRGEAIFMVRATVSAVTLLGCLLTDAEHFVKSDDSSSASPTE